MADISRRSINSAAFISVLDIIARSVFPSLSSASAAIGIVTTATVTFIATAIAGAADRISIAAAIAVRNRTGRPAAGPSSSRAQFRPRNSSGDWSVGPILAVRLKDPGTLTIARIAFRISIARPTAGLMSTGGRTLTVICPAAAIATGGTLSVGAMMAIASSAAATTIVTAGVVTMTAAGRSDVSANLANRIARTNGAPRDGKMLPHRQPGLRGPGTVSVGRKAKRVNPDQVSLKRRWALVDRPRDGAFRSGSPDDQVRVIGLSRSSRTAAWICTHKSSYSATSFSRRGVSLRSSSSVSAATPYRSKRSSSSRLLAWRNRSR